MQQRRLAVETFRKNLTVPKVCIEVSQEYQ